MNMPADKPSCIVLGEQSLLIQCTEQLLERGFAVLAVVTEDARIRGWCAQRQLRTVASIVQLDEALSDQPFEYLFSITNLRMLPESLTRRARIHAINFHDSPLPRYAGLNAPVWALLAGERTYGVSWHLIEQGADTGAVVASRAFAIESDDTVFSLNARCYENGLASFVELLDAIQAGTLRPKPQDLSARSYFGRGKLPPLAALLDWRKPVVELLRLTRGLDFGPYPNPVSCPKFLLGGRVLLARDVETVPAASDIPAGAVQAFSADSITVRGIDGAVRINRVSGARGEVVDLPRLLQSAGLAVGSPMPTPDFAAVAALESHLALAARHEDHWRTALAHVEPLPAPFASRPTATRTEGVWRALNPPARNGDPATDRARVIGIFALLLLRLADKSEGTVALLAPRDDARGDLAEQLLCTCLPLQLSVDWDQPFARLERQIRSSLDRVASGGLWLADLLARVPNLRGLPAVEELPVRIVLAEAAASAQAAGRSRGLTLCVGADGGSAGLLADPAKFDAAAVERVVAAFDCLAGSVQGGAGVPAGRLDLLNPQEKERVRNWASGERAALGAGGARCIHKRFEAQVTATPDRVACIAGSESCTYRELNARANRLARHLQQLGVMRGDLVGVMVERSIDMMVALYAVHKAGAAYVPLDPDYPRDRLAFMIAESKSKVVITQTARAAYVGTASQAALIDALPAHVRSLSDQNLDLAADASDLAYVIFTSGSTGKPKGVMIEHGNVTNFFDGMNRCISRDPGTWLAVTSISFDISVLELFWTLTNGYTVVLYADGSRKLVTERVTRPPSGSIDFSLFYWNVAKSEADYDLEKYRLLIEGAKFADANGFVAVWNPERHFEAFGGLFPNPSVTCAALATITSKVQLRAGSCVVPLHSPIRIAEEWAVVDNLSNGRVGLSIAAGWAPPDFAIKPENFANAKQVMFDSAETLRKLWRGETVLFPGPSGEVKVRTLPRPVQKELPVWMTTAGNIDSFVQAGRLGYNLLTHLLGQTVEEVSKKVAAYRAAWREAGHPGQGTVSLMLHTLVGPDADAVEHVVRQPLKDYLKSAMFLVKAAAWQFPTFKKMSDEQGKTLDQFFATISDEDMDGLLEYAFQRYFHGSGLFGTVEDCLRMVDKVKAAGVDEIACLIDFGIKTDVVLEHLPYLDALRKTAQSGAPAAAPAPLALHELMATYNVTHLQCTPSMATMLAGDPVAQPALRSLKHMMVGGEAFPPELARGLRRLVGGRITNMYGPTETTIWSSVAEVGEPAPPPVNHVSIGRPLLNQSMLILDARQQALPSGIAGELVIGGAGVARGYLERPDLTAQRFLPDPAADVPGARMYRTGDRARLLTDGRIECLGRVDLQVKIRGYRVELGEIEARLRDIDDIAEAVVVLREDVPGDKRLIAYFRAAPGRVPNPGDLKARLRDSLPEFMLPSAFVSLPAMPLTPNGKIDRKALPAAGQGVDVAKAGLRALPKGDMEAIVMKAWQKALGHSDFGARDNFFDIGGHSLLVVQVLKELRDMTGKTIQMTDLFKYTTVEALARFLAGTTGPTPAAAERGAARADARRAALERRRRP